MVKRSFALMTAAAVAFATLVAAPTAASAQQPAVQPAVTDFAQDLALHYDFSTVSGTTVPDASGNGRAGTIKGTGATVAGNVLTLPGGTSTSTAGYVQLPTGMFDGKNTLTISTWLKNETAAGNYAAMFFGSAASTPAQYWLLNPKNPSSRFKSVITNGNSTSAPWGTEAGISPTTAANGINGPVTTNAWGLYTTVIEPTQITGYFNGEKIGTVATSRTVTQFGTGLVGYIGRSSYPDAYYKGGVRDVKVWTAALDSAAVQSEFYAGADEATILAALEADRSALSIGASTVTSDITLSATGAKGSAITWASSAPGVVSTSGTVVRPTDGENAEVTLTATLMLAGRTAQRAFTVTVLPETPDADLSFEAERWVVEPVVASGQALPQPSGRFTAAWATETPGISVADGVISSTSPDPVEAEIDLTLGLNDAVGTLTKHFTVTVLPAAGTKYVLGYERTPLAQATYGPKVAYSLHLALGDGASSWTALNENYGVLFAKAQATEQLDIVSTRTLRDPFIFRLANGDFGVVATRALADGADDQSGKILYFTSPDLKQFTEVGLLDLGSTGGVNAPRAVWDSAADTYRLSWTTDAGATLHAAVGDLADSDTVGDARTGGLTLHAAEVSTTITGAVAKNVVPVSANTATALNGRFGRIANTSVSVDDVTVDAGGTVSLDGTKADLEYSDGSSAEFPIDWNAASIASIDTATPGDYEVTGTVRQRSYTAPFIGAEADPSIIKYNGKYLFISTDDAGVGIGATAMYLRQADTINGLKTAADHAIARVNVSNMKGCFWAPELHEIDGELYVFFSPCVGTASWTAVQSFVSKLEGDDPTVEANWTAAQPVLKADGSALRRDADHPGISLDMTTFEHDGTHYVAWSQRYITGSTGDAEIWIATIDPANPWRLTSEPVKLVTSEYGWDTNTSNVAEGPYFIERDGTVFLTYSGSNIDTTYALGLLTAPSGSSLIDPAVWTKWNAPVLKTDSAIAQLGPGHNSFTVDEDGKDVLVYHAKSTASSSRDTYLRRVHWAADGRPVLDMSRDEEVKPSLRTVTTTVTVLSDGTIKVPAAPAKPTVAVDGDDVTVSWQRPGDGGSPITSYIVRLYSGTDVAREVPVPDATRRSAVLEGIADGKYTAKVVAVNAVGNSPESAASDRAQVGAALLAQYDFEGLVSAPAAGSVVPDVSGEGRNATVRGTGVTSTGGALSLPGGASTSTAGYVQLPTGLFDGQNTVTVSAWLKNETAAGNYAALFFGTTETNPSQYWLLNPKNPSGLVKNVLTNGLSTSSPWNTEAGISPTTAANGVAGPAAKDGWTLHTAVIQPGSITGYVDGVKIGTVATTRTVSQFGDGLVSYIGKSSYPDALWKGSIRDLSIYSTVLSDADVKAAYWNGVDDNALVDAALAADADALDLGDGWVTGDLDLPGTGSKGSTIAWTSSVPGTIAADGTVQRPETGDVPVTLTATLTLAGRTVTRDFALTVLADTPQNDLRVIAERYSLGITKTAADIVLPAEVGGTTVAWTSSVPGSIAASGAVTRGDSSVDVVLTAVFSKEGLTATRTFDVTVLPRDAGRIGAYIREGATVRTDVLHLARSVDGAAYTALNNGRGLLYPTTGSTRLGSPLILRAPDGTFRLIATENGSSTRAYVYASDDLLSFSGEKLVTFAPSAATIVAARYDNGIRAYRITYSVGGSLSEVTTEDFGTFSAPVAKSGTAPVESGTFPTGSRQASSIGVTADELDAITIKYSRVVNTGVSAFEGVTVDQGDEVTLPETATVEYSSGDTTAMSVQWDASDVAALEGAEPGTYTVDGTVTRKSYPDPLVERRADPDVTKGDDGWYYFTGSYPMTYASDPQGYDRVILRRSKTIEGLKTAAESTIWHENTDSVLNRYIWAPELEKIGDDWYILFTASRSGVWDIRPAMLKYVGGDFGGEATLNSANWVSVGQVKAATGDAEAFTHFSLDMTHFESEGRHYLVWAEKPAIGSTLRMAEIDPENPTQLLTKSILLSTPTFAWEKNAGDSIDEGPAVIIKDGKIVIAFSAATVDDKYCVGVLTADVGADLLDVSSWTKNPYPLLTTDDVPGQVGPGHNSFTVDELGNPVIVYHSRTVGDTSNPGEATDAGLYDPRRHARAATVHWSADGLPVLNMTAAEELKPEYSAVSVTVTVRESLVGDTTLSGGTAVDGWYPGPVTVTAALSETRPATSVEIKVDGGEWTAVPLDSPSVQVDNDGQHSVRVRAADGGDWQEAAPVSFGVDSTAPVTIAVADGSARTLTLTAEDAGVGVDTIQYQLGDAGDWVDYTEPVAVGDAAVTVSYRSVDALGNREEARAEQFDAVTIPPAASTTRATVTPKSGAYGATRKVIVTVSAAGAAPTGTVVITDSFGVRTTTVASGSLKSGKVTLTLPKTLKVGTHGLTVTYSGSGTVEASSATASVKVAKASASVKATVKRAGSKGTAAKKLKATVTVTSSTKVPVTGKVTVTVKKSGKTVTTKSVTVKSSGKKVTLTTKALKKGKYTVTIRYAGSSTVNAATVTKSYRVK